jgi:hypothetical protein
MVAVSALKSKLDDTIGQLLDELQKQAAEAIEDVHMRAMQTAEIDKQLAIQQARYQERQKLILLIDIKLEMLKTDGCSSIVLQDLRRQINELGSNGR